MDSLTNEERDRLARADADRIKLAFDEAARSLRTLHDQLRELAHRDGETSDNAAMMLDFGGPCSSPIVSEKDFNDLVKMAEEIDLLGNMLGSSASDDVEEMCEDENCERCV